MKKTFNLMVIIVALMICVLVMNFNDVIAFMSTPRFGIPSADNSRTTVDVGTLNVQKK
jgi:hypothetical protein